ncbi:hypothetical protein P7C70_g2379, partial [Phenoliferia sp. Uapishka_3]
MASAPTDDQVASLNAALPGAGDLLRNNWASSVAQALARQQAEDRAAQLETRLAALEAQPAPPPPDALQTALLGLAASQAQQATATATQVTTMAGISATMSAMKDDAEKGVSSKGQRAIVAGDDGDFNSDEEEGLIRNFRPTDNHSLPREYSRHMHDRQKDIPLHWFSNSHISQCKSTGSPLLKLISDKGANLSYDADAKLGDRDRQLAQGRYVKLVTLKSAWKAEDEELRLATLQAWATHFEKVDELHLNATTQVQTRAAFRYCINIRKLAASTNKAFRVDKFRAQMYNDVLTQLNAEYNDENNDRLASLELQARAPPARYHADAAKIDPATGPHKKQIKVDKAASAAAPYASTPAPQPPTGASNSFRSGEEKTPVAGSSSSFTCFACGLKHGGKWAQCANKARLVHIESKWRLVSRPSPFHPPLIFRLCLPLPLPRNAHLKARPPSLPTCEGRTRRLPRASTPFCPFENSPWEPLRLARQGLTPRDCRVIRILLPTAPRPREPLLSSRVPAALPSAKRASTPPPASAAPNKTSPAPASSTTAACSALANTALSTTSDLNFWAQTDAELFDLDAFIKRIVTPLNAAAFRSALEEFPPPLRVFFGPIVHFIQHGFPLGFTPEELVFDESRVLMPPGRVEQIDRDFLHKYLGEQFLVHKITCGMSLSQLERKLGRPFQASPINRAQKAPEEKQRAIANFSHPIKGKAPYLSFNDQSRRHQTSVPTHWCVFSETEKLIALAHPLSLVSTYDATNAYRQLATLPEHRHMAVLYFDERYYMDGNVHMGQVPAADHWGMTNDFQRVLIDIRLKGRATSRFWVDDIYCLHIFTSAESFRPFDDAKQIKAIQAELGFDMNEMKETEPAEEFQCLGFVFNVKNKTVFLLEKKRGKYLAHAEMCAMVSHIWVFEHISKLCGYFSHLCYVVDDGRLHMSGLYSLLAKYDLNRDRVIQVQRGLQVRVSADLDFWLAILRAPGPIGRRLRSDPYPVFDIKISSDSSNTAISIYVGDVWDVFTLRPNWKGGHNGLNIDATEAYALYLVLLCIFDLYPNLQNATIRLACDNESVVKAWSGLRSRVPLIQAIFERMYQVLSSHGCAIDLYWVDTKINTDSDQITRGILPTEGRWIRPPIEHLEIMASSVLSKESLLPLFVRD